MKHLISKRAVLAGMIAAIAATLSGAAFADNAKFPGKPVRIVVPFTPGGSNDVVARVVGQKLAEYWGQAVIVDNRPGAGGNIGTKEVARAAADGYTLLVVANSFVINPHLYQAGKAGYDAFSQFTAVGQMAVAPVLLVVSPKLRVTTVKQLIDLAKTEKGKLTYASAGVGTPHHLSAELFKSMTGTDMVHVPYRGAVPAVTDLLGGQIDVMFGVSNSVIPQIKSGGLRALAVGGTKRLKDLPQIPTISEAGVPGFQSEVWLGLVAPTGTPAAVIAKLNADMQRAMASADVQAALAKNDIQPAPTTAVELANIMRVDDKKWAKVVQDTGAVAE